MKKKVYLSVLLVALLIVAVVALVMATGKSDLDVAREATERYGRMDLVLADGFAPLFECISDPSAGAMGVHYIQAERFDSRLELSEPEALVFEPQADGRRELVAVEYIIPAAAWAGSQPPTFLGQTLQYKTSVGPHEVDPYYELHAWVWEDNPSGMFADWNPEVGCLSSASAGAGSLSGSDVYDPAAAGLFPANSAGDLPPSGGYSGDDAYDPAAGGLATSGGRDLGFSVASEFGECLISFLPESCPADSSLADLLSSSELAAGSSYSGDDAYDPAAGGLGTSYGSEVSFNTASEFGECLVTFLPDSC